MSQAVVDHAEPVDVEGDDANGRAPPNLPVEGLAQAVDEQGTVRKAGQRIMERPLDQSLLRPLAVRDLLGRAEDASGSTGGIELDPTTSLDPPHHLVGQLEAMLDLERAVVPHRGPDGPEVRHSVVGVGAIRELLGGRALVGPEAEEAVRLA